MKLKPAALLLLCLVFVTPAAADDAEELVGKALNQLVRNLYVGDNSAAQGYLRAALERQPNHLEARWQMLYLKLVPLQNASLSDRAGSLAAVAPEFSRLAKLAKETNRPAFLHFATAMYAIFYHAYDRALAEIDRASAAEPGSARYATARGRILAGYGAWSRRDAEIERGVNELKRARAILRSRPSLFVRDENYDFYLAYAISDLSRPRWEEVIKHYRDFIEHSKESAAYGFAWNNLSSAYRHSGQCIKAKEAAEKAKERFGGDQANLRLAEFCIEMQKMGILASLETNVPPDRPAK